MCMVLTERLVRRRLLDRFGSGQLAELRRLDPECYRARLAGGGIAYATVEDDGTISIYELDVDGCVC